MALQKQEIDLLNNMNMITQQIKLGEKINTAIVAGENGDVSAAITKGDADTLEKAKQADATLKQQLEGVINEKHKNILLLTKMKKHNKLAAEATVSQVVTEVNALIDDLIKCGIMSST